MYLYYEIIGFKILCLSLPYSISYQQDLYTTGGVFEAKGFIPPSSQFVDAITATNSLYKAATVLMMPTKDIFHQITNEKDLDTYV